jgi:hypothetical protein
MKKNKPAIKPAIKSNVDIPDFSQISNRKSGNSGKQVPILKYLSDYAAMATRTEKIKKWLLEAKKKPKEHPNLQGKKGGLYYALFYDWIDDEDRAVEMRDKRQEIRDKRQVVRISWKRLREKEI